jgi:AraC-like DNA-binding protein
MVAQGGFSSSTGTLQVSGLHAMPKRTRGGVQMAMASVGSCARSTDVAFHAGFNNPSRFARMFKRKYGVSPRVFRNDGRE